MLNRAYLKLSYLQLRLGWHHNFQYTLQACAYGYQLYW
nr:MAG TPA: hypothetical protein [Caudoviricetes sp.]